MLRSMYSGISGMKNFQTKLDVIGNNIANVNTFGFKKGRATFKDALNQTVSGASAGGGATGGRNAVQIGLGSTLASIDTVHTNSSLQTTGRSLDLGIEGDGYFVLGQGDPDAGDMELKFSRSGNFYIDQNGFLVNADGLYVLDEDLNVIEVTTPLDDGSEVESFSIGSSGDLNVVANGANTTRAYIALATFSNSSGLTKVGNNIYEESANSGVYKINNAEDGEKASIASGFLEMSNVDLSEEFTEMIVAQRGFQANTRIITTSDEILQELVNLKR